MGIPGGWGTLVGWNGGFHVVSLKEWVAQNPGKLADVSGSSGVSLQTLRNVCNGMLLSSWTRAKAVSEATKGEVTPLELVATPEEIRKIRGSEK